MVEASSLDEQARERISHYLRWVRSDGCVVIKHSGNFSLEVLLETFIEPEDTGR